MKSIVFLTFLTSTLLMMDAKRIVKPRRQLIFNSSSANTVAIGLDLYTVSYYDTNLMFSPSKNRQVYLNVTSSDEDYELCKINLDIESDIITDNIRATSLWRKIVVWGIRNKDYSGNVAIFANYTFLLVDPSACTYKALPQLADKWKPGYYREPKVVFYQDRMDIFYISQTVCSPCSFDLNGQKIEMRQQLKPQKYPPVHDFHIRAVGRNYMYIVDYDYSQSLPPKLNLLDWKFETNKTAWLNMDFIDAVAINSAENGPYIGVVGYSDENALWQRIYTAFDRDLNVVFETYLPLLEGYYMWHAYANIDLKGNSYVTLVQRKRDQLQITMVRYDVNGRLIDEILIEPQIELEGDIRIFQEQAVLVTEQEYCFAVHADYYNTKTGTTCITCIDVRK